VAEAGTAGRPSAALRQVLVPLALAQFICSFAGTNMNVMINDMSEDYPAAASPVKGDDTWAPGATMWLDRSSDDR
jgi:hypothetical protein